MVNIFSKILDSNDKQIRRIAKIVSEINAIDDKKLTLDNLPKKTEKLQKEVLQNLKDILEKDSFSKEDVETIQSVLKTLIPQTFSYVRKAADLVASHRHFDVQLMGGIALFEGRLIELGTGEGKTLVATLPMVLYALLKKGAHMVTVNDYLARRDGEWCGYIYHALGLSTGVVTSAGGFKFVKDLTGIVSEDEIEKDAKSQPRLNQMHGLHLVPCSKKEAYACDITYCTNNELGFDYLRDNMSMHLQDMVMRSLFFCIVDEADSILIDESRTPLIISSPAQQSNDLYATFAQIVIQLNKDEHYTVNEKDRRVVITDSGIDTVEKILNVKNLWEDFLLAHHLENALSAKELFKNGSEYIVKDDQVLIVDEFTGRLMEGRRFAEGIHQAIEAKEGVHIQEESRTLATITFQNLFRLYPILAGMTGTALTEAEEFAKIYSIDVIVIPPHKTLIRKDHNDVVYKSESAKFRHVIDEIKERHEKGQPVLVGTISVERSEILSELLRREGLEHQVLNAKYHEKEAEIISHAGEKGQITISTNMAGRGTDITLGEGVKEIGGLAIIGTERHESRRIDNQLRGRAGRQGDPGESRFYISLEDNLMRIFGGARVASIMNSLKFDENIPLEFSIFSRQIESAQKKVENLNFDRRKQLVEYDDVLNTQREIIYKRRRFILTLFNNEVINEKISEERREYILDKAQAQVERMIDEHAAYGEIDDESFTSFMKDFALVIPTSLLAKIFEAAGTNHEEWEKLLLLGTKKLSTDKLKEQTRFLLDEAYNLCETVFTPQIFVEKNKQDMLRVIDILWMEHLDAIESLKETVGLSQYSQRDPLVEYKNQAYLLFENFIATVEAEIVLHLFNLEVVQQNIAPEIQITNEAQIEAILKGGEPQNVQKQFITNRPSGNSAPIKSTGKIGRNDPCPCGSGLKYKKCGEIHSPVHEARISKLA